MATDRVGRWSPTASPPRRRFHPTEVSYIYSRYKRVGDEAMDESFFPVLWTEGGGGRHG